MKNQIIDYLQITSEEYDKQLFEYFFDWCKKFGVSPSHIQQLLANTHVSNWFMREFSKYEKHFCDAVPTLPKKAEYLKYHYYGFIGQVFLVYPKPLIDAIKNAEIQIQVKLLTDYSHYHAN